MSTSILCTLVFLHCLLLLSCFDVSMAARNIPSSAPSTMVRPLVTEGEDRYVSMKPQDLKHKQQVFHGREVKGCKPKGFRHASAPSRFVNSAGCSSDMHTKKPWDDGDGLFPVAFCIWFWTWMCVVGISYCVMVMYGLYVFYCVCRSH